jgi:uncharacterized protein (DUF58 family)
MRHRRPRRRYHLGAPAGVYVIVTLLLAVGAFNSQNNLLFWALGFAFAALIVSGLLSGRMLMGLAVRRHVVAAGHAGDRIDIHYRIHNVNRLTPAYALSLMERSLEPRSFANARERRPPLAVAESAAFVVHVPPRGAAEAVLGVRCLRRGILELDRLRATTAFPFGLIRKSMEYRQPTRLIVRPRIAPLRPGVWESLQAHEGHSSTSASSRSGTGEEFFSLREFADGDSPRSVAWRASARRMAIGSLAAASGSRAGGLDLLVRQNSASATLRLWVVLRLSRSASLDAENERAISLGASIMSEGVRRGLHVGICVPVCDLIIRPAGVGGSGSGHLDRVYDRLASIRLGDEGAVSTGRRHSPRSVESFPRAALDHGSRGVVVHAGPIDPDYTPKSARVTDLSSLDEHTIDPHGVAPRTPDTDHPMGAQQS